MNALAHRALVADHERSRRARVRRDRARLAGGRVRVDSSPGSGTQLTAELPRIVVEGRAG